MNRRILIVTGAAIVVIAMVALAWWYGARGGIGHPDARQAREPLPFAPGKLPNSMSSLWRDPIQAGEPEQARWSYFAHGLCGGHDIYESAMLAAEKGLLGNGMFRRELARLLGSPRDELKATLICGKAVADKVPLHQEEYSILFPPHGLVNLVRLSLDRPAAATSYFKPAANVPNLTHLRCSVGWSAHAGADCLPDSSAAARVKGTDQWTFGSLEDLTGFGSQIETEGTPTHMQQLVNELATTLADYPRVSIHAGAKEFFEFGHWAYIEPTLSLHGTTARKHLEEAVREIHLWARAARSVGSDGGEVRMEIVPKTQSDGDQIAAALSEYFKVLRRALELDRPRLNDTETQWPEPAHYRTARNNAHWRAWKQPQITRVGAHVVVTVDTTLRGEERTALRQYETWRATRRQAAARIVDALLAGSALPDDQLHILGGDYLVGLVQSRYRAFFEGDWKCSARGANKHLSFVDGRAYSGEGRKVVDGSYTFDIPKKSFGWQRASVRVSKGGAVVSLRIKETYASPRRVEIVEVTGGVDKVEVPADGKKFTPPIEPGQLPGGAWYCDLGSVHYARMKKGDPKCPLCGMVLKEKVDQEYSCSRVGDDLAPGVPPERAVELPAPDWPAPADGRYYTMEDLRGMGFRVERIEPKQFLACGSPWGGCVCIAESLPCEEKKDCITLEENIKVFREALKAGPEGRMVICDHMEVGRCGEHRYLDFAGDIHRYEARWFDVSGRLVGQRNATDYDAYCAGRASMIWRGRIPYCPNPSREELLCGEAKRPMKPPIEDLVSAVRR